MSERYDELHDERLSALYQETRHIEPPHWLDQRILAMAQSTASPHPASTVAPLAIPTALPTAIPKRRAARWIVPLTLAATVVLTVGVVNMTSEFADTPSSLKEAARIEAVDSTLKSAVAPDTDAVVGRAAPLSPSDATAPSAAPSFSSSFEEARPALPAAVPTPPAATKRPSARSLEWEKPTEELAAPTPVEKKAKPDAAQRRDPSPQEWLAQIAQLRRQGRTAEADTSLAEFRRAYPDYPLNGGPPPR